MRFAPSKTYSRASFYPPIATPPPHRYMQIFVRLSPLVHLSCTTRYFLFHNSAAAAGLPSTERVVIIHKQPTTLFHRQHYIEVPRKYIYIRSRSITGTKREYNITNTPTYTLTFIYIYIYILWPMFAYKYIRDTYTCSRRCCGCSGGDSRRRFAKDSCADFDDCPSLPLSLLLLFSLTHSHSLFHHIISSSPSPRCAFDAYAPTFVEYEFLQCTAQGPLEQRYTTAVIVFYSRALTCHATSANTTADHVLLFTTAPLPHPHNDTESKRSSTLRNRKLSSSWTPPHSNHYVGGGREIGGG